MSFYKRFYGKFIVYNFLPIPFVQGDVFRRYNREDIERIFDKSQSLSIRAMSFDYRESDYLMQLNYVSIPFEQGYVFRLASEIESKSSVMCLNPFRAGQCLSTNTYGLKHKRVEMSQSLSIRAMSFDCKHLCSLNKKK